MKFKIFAMLALAGALLASCNDEFATEQKNDDLSTNGKEFLSQSEAERTFSEVLSKAIYAEPRLRKFLKNEALLKNDNDYNIFYPLSKNKIVIGDKSFIDVLQAYCDNHEDLANIEKAAPLLNIFIPDLSLFDENLSVEKLDVEDGEVPVFNAGKFYWKGEVVDSICEATKNAYPVFHTFVVNESPRRKIKNAITRTAGLPIEYGFADEAFDPRNNSLQEGTTRGRTEYEIYEKEALNELLDPNNNYVRKGTFPGETLTAFSKVGAGNGVLRSMMYYNLNKIEDINQDSKTPDYNVRDVIYRMKIDPYLYYLISSYKEQITGKEEFQSPYLKDQYFQKGGDMPAFDYVLTQLWTQGNFNFKKNTVTGENTQLMTIAIRPQDLFSVTLRGKFKHKTWGHRAQYWFWINATELGSKWFYPHQKGIDARFPVWSPFAESYKRTIFVSVAGSSITVSKEVSVSSTIMKKDGGSASTGVKLPLGQDNKGDFSINLTSTWVNQHTYNTMTKVSVQVSDKDISTGDNAVNFFGNSPILSVSDDKVYLDTERFGCFDMCIVPVKKKLQ